MTTSDWLAAASLSVAVVALVLSVYAILRANKTTSAATLVTLHEALRQAWSECFAARERGNFDYELGNLLNLLEIACAIYLEKSLTGNSRVLGSEFLSDTLKLLTNNEIISEKTVKLLQGQNTFIFIKRFLKENRVGPGVVLPVEWHQLR